MEDVNLAVSMYFAQKYDDYLLALDESEFVFFTLFIVLGVQLIFERRARAYLHDHQTLWADICMSCLYMVSRTLAFLLVSYTIQMLTTRWNHLDGFWGEEVILPIVVIFGGLATMKHVVRLEEEKNLFHKKHE